MLVLDGCANLTIADLLFYGRPEWKPEAPATSTIIRSRPIEGHGPLLVTFRNLSFIDAGIGTHLEPEPPPLPTDLNNSEMLFERLSFSDCDTCFRNDGVQGLNYLWNLVHARACKTVFNLAKGGCINVQTAAFQGCGSGGTLETDRRYPIVLGEGGQGNGMATFNAIRIESNTSTLLRTVGDFRIVIDAFLDANPEEQPYPMFAIANSGLTVRGSKILSSPALVFLPATTRKTTVRFRDCEFPNANLNDVEPPTLIVNSVIANETEPDSFFSIEKCDAQYNQPFIDVKTTDSW